MKETKGAILKVYQLKRMYDKVVIPGIRKKINQKGIGPKTSQPLWGADAHVSYVAENLDWLIDRLEGDAPNDVDEDGDPLTNDQLVDELLIEDMTEAIKFLNEFLDKKDDEDIKQIRDIVVESRDIVKKL